MDSILHKNRRDASETLALRKMAGNWIRAQREKCGLSQRELAERVGLDYYTFVSQLETGRGRIPPDKYTLWAKAFDMDAKSLVMGLMPYYEPEIHKILFES